MSSETSAAYQIFHRYFKCWMPQHHLYDRQFMETFGIPTSSDRDVDRELANSDTLCQLTVAEMAQHLNNGANLTLEDPKDSVVIYKLIQEHMRDWQAIVSDTFNTTEPPIDDLKMLDELAAEVFKIAHHYIEKDDGGSRLFNKLSSMESKRAMSRFAPAPVSDKPTPRPEHKRISDYIAKKSFKNTHRWR